METKKPWLQFFTFMGRHLAKWSNSHPWHEKLSHWAMEALILLLVLVGDNTVLAKILILLVGISIGVKMSRSIPVLWTRSSALEENRGRWQKKISTQEGNKKKEGTKSTSWCYRTLCGPKMLAGSSRKYSSKVAGDRSPPCPTSSGSSRHGMRLSLGVALDEAAPLKMRGPPAC